MTEDATLDHEGAPGMVAPNEGQEPATAITDGAGGAPVNEPGEEERLRSPREVAIESITANRLRDLAEETGVPIISPEHTESAPAERKLKVKVDGEELEISESEVLKGYQKDQTASRRLEHAAAESKRVQDEWARLNAERAEFEQTRKPAQGARPAGDDGPTNSQATPLDDDSGSAKRICEALVSGDEDEAVAAIKKLTQGRPREAIPPEKIAAQVRQQIAWDDAQGRFSQDYKDIVADPLLSQIASNTLTETLKTAKSYDQAFREAGDRTRAWVRGAGGVMPQEAGNTPADPGLAEKQSRKERIDNPTAINARAAGKPQETAETPSDTIKAMRSARGLPA